MSDIIFDLYEYKVSVRDYGDWVGVTVRYPFLPNPYSSVVSRAAEAEALERIGQTKKVVLSWAHDPSMTDQPQGRFTTGQQAIDACIAHRDVDPFVFLRFGYVYDAGDGSYDYLIHHEDRYVSSFIPMNGNLLFAITWDKELKPTVAICNQMEMDFVDLVRCGLDEQTARALSSRD